MRPLIMVMLAVQAVIFLGTAWAVMFGRASPRNPRRPVWSSLVISLVIVASASWNIADHHSGEEGADILQFGAALLLGMGLMAVFMLIRQRRNLDAPA